jgi:hypothetical protein
MYIYMYIYMYMYMYMAWCVELSVLLLMFYVVIGTHLIFYDLRCAHTMLLC